MYNYTSNNKSYKTEAAKRFNEKIAKLNNMHTVPHVDMDAILSGKEKRLTIEESRQKGVALCNEFMKELHS